MSEEKIVRLDAFKALRAARKRPLFDEVDQELTVQADPERQGTNLAVTRPLTDRDVAHRQRMLRHLIGR